MPGGAAEDGLAGLLRRYRLVAGLSQEELAERAGLSVRGVSDLERGIRRLPHPATLARLADALGLDPGQRTTLLAVRHAAVQPPAQPEVPAAPAPPMPALGRDLSSFVGRQQELAGVGRLLLEAPLVTLAGPGGAGKTRLARSGLRLARTSQLVWSEAMLLNTLGDVLRAKGDADAAAEAYAQALPTLQTMNGGHPPEGMLHNLAYVALARGDLPAAVTLFLESADRYRTTGGDRRGLAECAIGLGAAAVRLGQTQQAAQLFGAAEATLEQLGTPMTPSNRTDYARARADLAARLDPDELARLDAEGRNLRLEHALERARDLATRPAVRSPQAVGPAAELTARELEVAQLLAGGYRNREIAERLVITEKTAANHVQRVLDKLGVPSRAQVAARAAALGLARANSPR